MIDNQGWYQFARRVPSPFCDQRSDEQDISLLVVHNISLPPGQFGGPYIEQFFTGQLDPNQHPFFRVIHTMGVSAHCLIRRDGEVVQFVPFSARAWHAGQSSFAGRARCNDYSIGIELEGTDFVAYTEAQYQALAALSDALMTHYPAITLSRITGHQYIAPMRKTDPGLVFDWQKYRASLKRSD
ncbi:1,6-anhydro-N-acetylmuramyl-L-alanine amidase AmpD [Vibrio fluvialis]|nr:1,6-anhydro-N-acetylmuramyl-L-alanine amidase AmpD [Vibrio fluvialis]MBY7953953.1 1,6-anhydro-N-acetylmuramyl-L-alanine amidase AmpD [Vibrio fluvialis]MBY8065068.1 1,6-anhydro-N-acetylmuramyl-L-alanine amidase AmpD [Vibrio fluvialis]MBY8133950.1 1,6-anhydro-N-acetylmuramyl-L-alanine amidase AmpD [Vibrio fluvialis]